MSSRERGLYGAREFSAGRLHTRGRKCTGSANKRRAPLVRPNNCCSPSSGMCAPLTKPSQALASFKTLAQNVYPIDLAFRQHSLHSKGGNGALGLRPGAR